AIDPAAGFSPFQARKLAFGLKLEGEQVKQASKVLSSLYRVFVETDASLVEVNPCVVTRDARVMALDAKINFDDNALYRHPELRELRDLNEEEELEVEAVNAGVNYIKLD
ncbi:succinate--CoA ligase subunit beta, partial [Acidobacteriia bacterium AH_259_A11_L15]|nr:succinate--CoA ligase subunit beta [Acidobacteriia bacterium AH_259_A11_L15]